MRKLACFGFWTGLALYAAVGLVGAVLFSMRPDIASATDRGASRNGAEIAVRLWRSDAPTPPHTSALHWSAYREVRAWPAA